MIRVINTALIKSHLEFDFSNNIKTVNEVDSVEDVDAILPCYTEKLKRINDNAENVRWCTSMEGGRTNEVWTDKIETEFDYYSLHCTPEVRRMKKY